MNKISGWMLAGALLVAAAIAINVLGGWEGPTYDPANNYQVVCGSTSNTVIASTNTYVTSAIYNSTHITVRGGEWRYSLSGIASNDSPTLADGYTLQFPYPEQPPPYIGIQAVSGVVTAEVSRSVRGE
jgi:hypothetical protein